VFLNVFLVIVAKPVISTQAKKAIGYQKKKQAKKPWVTLEMLNKWMKEEGLNIKNPMW